MLYLPWVFTFHWGLQVTKFGVEEVSKGLNPCVETKLIMHVQVHTSHKPKLAYIRWLKLQPSSISLVWFVHVAWKFKEKDVSLKKNEYGKTSIIRLFFLHRYSFLDVIMFDPALSVTISLWELSSLGHYKCDITNHSLSFWVLCSVWTFEPWEVSHKIIQKKQEELIKQSQNHSQLGLVGTYWKSVYIGLEKVQLLFPLSQHMVLLYQL